MPNRSQPVLAVLPLGGLGGVAEDDRGNEQSRRGAQADEHRGDEPAREPQHEADHEQHHRAEQQDVARPLAPLGEQRQPLPPGAGSDRSWQPSGLRQQRRHIACQGPKGEVLPRRRARCGRARSRPGTGASRRGAGDRRWGTTGSPAPGAQWPPGSGRPRQGGDGAPPRPAGCRTPPTREGNTHRVRRGVARRGRAGGGGEPPGSAPGRGVALELGRVTPPRGARAASRWRRAPRRSRWRAPIPLRGIARTGWASTASSGADAERSPDALPIAGAWVGVEPVHDHGGLDASLGELAPGEAVDAHVTPGRVVGRHVGHCGVRGSLPGRVVVVEHRRAAPQHAGQHLGGGPVQRQGQEVLDQHQVGVTRARHPSRRRSAAQGPRWPGPEGCGRRVPPRRPSTVSKPSSPRTVAQELGGHRHAVGEPEAEADDGAGGHGGDEWRWRCGSAP